jgi:dTDP-glucose pyrophosphorylase
LEPLLSGLGHIVWIDDVTEGAACTVLKVKDLINNDDPLLISDCDQLIGGGLEELYKSDKDATILTVESDNPAFSYVSLEDGKVVETAEKKVISNISACGKHFFKKGRYFVEAAEKMIKSNKRVNNEFYITPIYNEMLFRNIGICEAKGWEDIGTPENLKKYLDDHQTTNL